jgi:hypothetical protein
MKRLFLSIILILFVSSFSYSQTQAELLKRNPTPVQLMTATVAVVNGDVLASTDVSAYSFVSVQLSTAFVGTVSWFGSNDGVNFNAVFAKNEGLSTIPTTFSTANGNFTISPTTRFLRIRVTAYTSGTVTGTVYGHFKQSDISQFSQNITSIGNGALTLGGKAGTASIPNVPATDYAECVAKEWKVVTATGVPAAAVGDILTSCIKSNSAVFAANWYNNNSQTRFTTNPTIANLTENSNKGQLLSGTQNGRQSWCASAQNNGVMTSTATFYSLNVVVDGVLQGLSTTYTVPTGKRLRITSFQGGGFTNGFGGTNTAIYDEGYWFLTQAAAVTPASPIIAQVSFGVNYINPTAGNATPVWNAYRAFVDGEVDVAAGQQIGFVGKNLNNTMGFRNSLSWQGYLYNQ